jgi:hypothetical protein
MQPHPLSDDAGPQRQRISADQQKDDLARSRPIAVAVGILNS